MGSIENSVHPVEKDMKAPEKELAEAKKEIQVSDRVGILGLLNYLKPKVIFNARIWSCIESGELIFDAVDINVGGMAVGGRFDQSTGTFRVPVGGIYKMSFSLLFEDSRGIEIDVVNRGVVTEYEKLTIANFGIVDESFGPRNGAYTWMMYLIKGDEIYLNAGFDSLPGGKRTLLCPDELTFTGELI